MIGVLLGYKDICRQPLEHNVDVDQYEHLYCSTPLTQAIFKGVMDIVRLLVEHKAQVDLLAMNRFGNTLACAASLGRAEIVKFLIESGASAVPPKKLRNGRDFFLTIMLRRGLKSSLRLKWRLRCGNIMKSMNIYTEFSELSGYLYNRNSRL